MAIINCEKGTLRPDYILGFGGWLHHVENDGNSILIIISDKSLMCISSIGLDKTNAFGWAFGGLEMRKTV